MDFPKSTQNAGTDGWKIGELARHLPPVRLANMSSAVSETSAERRYRVLVQGLSDCLTLHVAVGVVTAQRNGNQAPILPADYPANPGTMQLFPIVDNGEMPPLYLREVFQDPTATDNADNALGQNIPFGWSFEPEGADQVRVEIVLPATVWDDAAIDGALVCAVTASYTGAWQDPKAVALALGKVRIQPSDNNPPTIGTGGL